MLRHRNTFASLHANNSAQSCQRRLSRQAARARDAELGKLRHGDP